MQETVPHETPMPTQGLQHQQPYDRRQQILHELLANSELLLKNQLEVRHLMSRDLVAVTAQTSHDELVRLLEHHQVHHLLVCGRGGELIGVISDRDLLARRGANAQQLMSFPVRTVTPNTPVSPAITCLISERISCLPVVENGRPCGILTTSDLVLTLQATLQLWLRLSQVLQHDLTGAKRLDEVVASLQGELTAEQLVERIATARKLLQECVRETVGAVDLHTDVLTGMSSRHGLDEVLGMFLAIHRRYEQPFALALASIDHYRRIQTICGDVVIKTLVKAVARLIGEAARDSDFIARYREDSFAVLMPHTTLAEAEAFCMRLRELARTNAGLDIELRISTAVVTPEPNETVGRILCRAEALLV